MSTLVSPALISPARRLQRLCPVQLNDDLWRVTRPDGEVLGYIERSSTAAGHRFIAKRMLQRQHRFLPIGEFWALDAAIECFGF